MDEEFNLVYYHRITKEKFMVKRITKHDYIILYPYGERVRISEYHLKKVYVADKANQKAKMKTRILFWKKIKE